jgi:hypothetical protein
MNYTARTHYKVVKLPNQARRVPSSVGPTYAIIAHRRVNNLPMGEILVILASLIPASHSIELKFVLLPRGQSRADYENLPLMFKWTWECRQ